MQTAHPTIRLQDADPVAVLAVLTVRIAALLHAEYPAAGRFASGAGGAIGVGEGAGGWWWRVIFAPAPGLRLRAAGGQQTRQRALAFGPWLAAAGLAGWLWPGFTLL